MAAFLASVAVPAVKASAAARHSRASRPAMASASTSAAIAGSSKPQRRQTSDGRLSAASLDIGRDGGAAALEGGEHVLEVAEGQGDDRRT
ncbi:MAG: hypothetical protein WDN45_16920 [Caulobacteraceae bacterium]